MTGKRAFQFEDVGDGKVLVRAQVMVGPLRVTTEIELDPIERDQLFEVLTRARSRDVHPEGVKAIAIQRRGVRGAENR